MMTNTNNRIQLVERRRKLLLASASLPALAWAGATCAQAKPPVLIGWLEAGYRERYLHRLSAFKEGMAVLGWKEGVHYVLEERWAQGRTDRLPALAAELAAKKPAIIVAAPTPPTVHAAKAAPTTPIVQANGDPLLTGSVKSLARPGGMITGLTNINVETGAKLVELLRDAVPNLRIIGWMADPSNPGYGPGTAEARRAAEQLQLKLIFADARRPEDIEPALSRLAKDGVQALILSNSAWFLGEQQRIVNFGLAQRWPIIAPQSEFANAGALATYGADRAALFRRAAYFVDRILKGTKPADLPIERPTKFETVVNLKTAKALGLTIPQTVMVRADRVIE